MSYLDYQATTPLAPEALAAMLPWLESQHANPHSPHREGRRAKAAVELARDQVAALLPPGGRIAFTSGATEALNWAIKGTAGPITTLATEHAAVLDTAAAEAAQGRDVTILPVGADGIVDSVPSGAGVVAAMLVNNEIGVIQPIAALAEAAHAAGALMLVDAVQGYGRVAIPDTVDLIAISAHKIHGPKGIGALWIRDGVTLAPLMHGGGQEAPGRSGTLSPALCAGFGVAAQLMADRRDQDAAHVERLWALARDRLGPGWTINGATDPRYHGNLNVRREGLDVNRLMSDLRDIAFSAGSACASGSGRSSHVLRAIGLSETQARSSIRLGFGRYTTETDLAAAIDAIAAAAEGQWP
ncbi:MULTISPECIES: cysteine desulfurase family protein [unclassified Sphingomonas]|jgi:cysteine desulfurase|uniref:cysteine desulfurase family protein n=2 Tax=Sphingomonas TaxID=13687 RepID=UPI00177A7F82|nr:MULTISPECIES: cysteine desulfurase family protein [unclassified Sphingomonas]MBD8468775.1 cysteine desulfurase [Sphingomonas sp. CFBP 8765]MDY1008365.1 cysteine desulfurase family protein [Sphingomonas sp. CFBP9019]